jgi:hypothetical protein
VLEFTEQPVLVIPPPNLPPAPSGAGVTGCGSVDEVIGHAAAQWTLRYRLRQPLWRAGHPHR